jgi:hypothetical protein
MSTGLASRSPSKPAPGTATLADVLAAVEDCSCPVRQRQDRASAIRTLAKALGRRPEEVPAHPGHLQRLLKESSPAMAGLTPRRWRNILSLTRAALRQAGISTVPARDTAPVNAGSKMHRLAGVKMHQAR